MIAETIPALSALSPDDKILLAAELWQDAVGNEAEEPDPGIVDALRERLQYDREHPDEGSSWDEVRSRILDRRRP